MLLYIVRVCIRFPSVFIEFNPCHEWLISLAQPSENDKRDCRIILAATLVSKYSKAKGTNYK